MTSLLSRYWFLLPLLILVLVIIDRAETPEVFQVEQTIDMRETQSDYYLSEFRSRKFDADGQIKYTVAGDTLAHYPNNDRSEITEPRINLHRQGTQWQIESSNGTFDPNPDLFTLQGNVVVTRQTETSDPVIIRTSSLTVATEFNEVSTDAPIEISAPTWRLQATGLKSAIDQGKLTLLSDVIGRYEVPGL